MLIFRFLGVHTVQTFPLAERDLKCFAHSANDAEA
jgi:hypothetical protein